MVNVMSRKLQYHVIREHTLAKLETAVSDYLEDGWVPAGGIATSTDLDGVKFYMQAMYEKIRLLKS